MIINTVEGRKATADSYAIRREALQHKVAYTTTLAGGDAISTALQHKGKSEVKSLQELHRLLLKEKMA